MTINSMYGSLRCINGYLDSKFNNKEIVGGTGYTIRAYKSGWALDIQIDLESAITSIPNNTPVVYTGNINISL